LARIRRKFDVTTEDLCIGPLRLRFTRPTDPDDVLDMVVRETDRLEKLTGQRIPEDRLHLPYWAQLWDSALGIGAFLAAEAPAAGSESGLGSLFAPGTNPPNVLDLGCGMGLTSAVLARLGAIVTMADLEPDALLFARLNTIDAAGQVHARRLNWRTDQLGRRFDLIVAADILYDREEWTHIERFLRAHACLRSRAPAVVLGEPGRQTGEAFVPWIMERGWFLREFAQPIPTRERPIRVFLLRPPLDAENLNRSS
jgi:predicted nicotinamide N-methyase